MLNRWMNVVIDRPLPPWRSVSELENETSLYTIRRQKPGRFNRLRVQVRVESLEKQNEPRTDPEAKHAEPVLQGARCGRSYPGGFYLST